jgi:hypothetical protein
MTTYRRDGEIDKRTIQATRTTVNTLQKANRMRRLVAEFRTRDLSTDGVCKFLELTASGARSYIYPLRDANVIALHHWERRSEKSAPMATYRITGDELVIAEYLTTLQQPGPPKPPKPPTVPRNFKSARPVYQMHILADDEPHRARRIIKIPAPDPLLAALFGRRTE